MKKANINNALTAEYPESFKEMNSTELKRFFVTDKGRCGFHDTDRHMVLNVAWTKPGILGFLTDERSVLRGAEMRLKYNLPTYHKTEDLSAEIAGCKAIGISFEYQVINTDIIQRSDLYVFKFGKAFYSPQIIARKDVFEDSRRIMEKFLGSIKSL